MSDDSRQKDEAFQVLYSSYLKQVYYSAYSIIKDRELAEDAVQETFLKAYRQFDALKQHNRKEAWLKAISRNVAIDMYRRQRREKNGYHRLWYVDRSESSIEQTITDREILDSLLASLEPVSREALLLVYVYGLSYEQLACYQKTSVSAVKSRIHRAKRKLHGAVSQMEVADEIGAGYCGK